MKTIKPRNLIYRFHGCVKIAVMDLVEKQDQSQELLWKEGFPLFNPKNYIHQNNKCQSKKKEVKETRLNSGKQNEDSTSQMTAQTN